MYLGADPEFFIFAPDGRPVPAHRVGINGKDRKHLVGKQDGPRGGAKFFRDGYAVEINPVPQDCRSYLIGNGYDILREVQAFLPAGYHLGATPTVKVDIENLMSDAPEDVRHFGCDPSYCAYRLEPKVPNVDARVHPYRYSGGHIHIETGYPGREAGSMWVDDPENYPIIIKLLDKYVGLLDAALFHHEGAWLRRRYYGQAGEFRPQAYTLRFPTEGNYEVNGLEYRTPGPEMWNHPAVAQLMFGVTRWVVREAKFLASSWDHAIEADLQAAINEGRGVNRLLASVPGFYTPDSVARLREVIHLHDRIHLELHPETHYGLTEYSKDWGIKL